MTTETRVLLAKAMTEKDLQAKIVKLADLLGYWVYHTLDSKGSTAGFPDLVLVHRTTGRLIFAECKTETGTLSGPQIAWGNVLTLRHFYVIWRPSDWLSGKIEQMLKERARR